MQQVQFPTLRPLAQAPCTLPTTPPVLRLLEVGLGERSLSLQAVGGEIVHLQGGTPGLQLRLLALAAGHADGSSGRCELLGHDVHALSAPALRGLREACVGRVLAGDRLPDAATVLACVAQPLQQQGLPYRDAVARAALELDALGAAALAPRSPASLQPAELQLALLARATALRPRLLVLQHPEIGLAPPAVEAVRLALWALSSAFETCVLMSTAHPRLAATADRCVDLDRAAAYRRPVLS